MVFSVSLLSQGIKRKELNPWSDDEGLKPTMSLSVFVIPRLKAGAIQAHEQAMEYSNTAVFVNLNWNQLLNSIFL